MAEKDKLLRELDRCKEQLNVSKEDVLHISDHVLEQRQAQSLEMEVCQKVLCVKVVARNDISSVNSHFCFRSSFVVCLLPFKKASLVTSADF